MKTKIVLLASLFLSATDVQAWAQTRYHLTDLGPLSGNDANGINAAGQIVGGEQFGPEFNAFLYSGGSTQDLGTLSPSQTWSVASGINNAGQVVGTSQTIAGGGVGTSFGFIYSNGTMTAIPGLGGVGYTFGNAINNAGQVVGISLVRNSDVTHAYLYSGGVTTDLGDLNSSYAYSDAYGINDSGQIVGVSSGALGHDRGFIWQNGTMTDLGDLYGGSAYTRAYAINNLGQAVGESWPASTQLSHAFIWQDGVMADLGVLPGTFDSLAQGINDEGEVVGTSQISQGASGTHLAFLWDATDGMQNLTDLLDSSGDGWTLEGAKGINDAGQIIGYGQTPSGQQDAFLLTPTPEPGTLVMLCAGSTFLLGCVWRRRARKLAKFSSHKIPYGEYFAISRS